VPEQQAAVMQEDVGILWALDVATGGGLDITINGKEWRFSTLTFRQGAELTIAARSDALRAYWAAAKDYPRPWPGCNIELSTILFGAAAQMAFTDPATRWMQVKLSLLKHHPQVTDAEIDAMFDDEDTAMQIIAAVQTMTHGPFTQKDLAEGDGAANPTKTSEALPDTGPASATS